MEYEEIPVDDTPYPMDRISDAILNAIGGSLWWTRSNDSFYGIWLLKSPTMANCRTPWIMG